jgi:hypothetical protein
MGRFVRDHQTLTNARTIVCGKWWGSFRLVPLLAFWPSSPGLRQACTRWRLRPSTIASAGLQEIAAKRSVAQDSGSKEWPARRTCR